MEKAITWMIFLLVYAGMILGSWPGFALDRTGIALLGAIALIEIQGITISQATTYIDFPALAILFSFMILSAQFYYSGFYTRLIEKIKNWPLTSSQFLFITIFVSASLSAFLINDIVCLALTPLIIKACINKKLDPIPFLIALACSSNIGSALTLIGNPQNLLIGQVMNIPFSQYLKFSLPPCMLSLLGTWWIVKFQIKESIQNDQDIYPEIIPFNSWQSLKGIFVILILLLIFLFTELPRDKVSLAAAGFLLLSRRMTSQAMLNFIDWQLLVLFIGLFIVNRGFFQELNTLNPFFKNSAINMQSPLWIVILSLVLSNIFSNVPAVMLLLPFVKTSFDGSVLALSSTFAGNLFIVGSIANIIVIYQASKYGVKIGWKKYIRIGIPVTCVSFIIIFGWLLIIRSI